ncbi:hypothetical protein DdX_18636 [Ditylenchus destructor]|uniref:Uncharacterized protein n=1 Tax=Ditylenchus destructor TaxID=166010 RepID=A0AAD4MP52_9BILA|nr:hypothetical protein DdX_18636 [Ditylenchus destructor]
MTIDTDFVEQRLFGIGTMIHTYQFKLSATLLAHDRCYPTVYGTHEKISGVRNYEPYALLVFGIGSTIHTYLPTLSALLLTLDRCFTLTFPMQYNSRMAKRFLWLTLTCYTSWSIFVTYHVLREIPLDVEKG